MGNLDTAVNWSVAPDATLTSKGTETPFDELRSGTIPLQMITTDLAGITIPIQSFTGNDTNDFTIPQGSSVILKIAPGNSNYKIMVLNGDVSNSDLSMIDRKSILAMGQLDSDTAKDIISDYDLAKYNLPPYRVLEENLVPSDLEIDPALAFDQAHLNEMQISISAELNNVAYTNGISVTIDTDKLFPEVGGSLAADFGELPEKITVAGISSHAFNKSFGCRWDEQRDAGATNGLESYTDVGSAFLGVHESAHVLNALIDPARNGFDAVDGQLIAQEANVYDIRTNEVLSDATAAIYMLNRNPDNPRVAEFIDRFSLRREAAAHSRPDHETSDTLKTIVGNKNLWENGGQPLTLEQAHRNAIQLLENSPSLTAKVNHSPEHVAAAQAKFCLLPN